MRERSVFGEIVTRFTSHPENIATEALRYLLSQYPTTWPCMRMLLEQSGVKFDEQISFRTQASSHDGSIPDLIGVDRDGDRVLVLEAKFWAGLTPNQPVTYLSSLPGNKPAMVLVVAPGLRFNMLWHKLRSVSESSGITLGPDSDIVTEFRVAQVNDFHALAQLSWRALLAVIHRNAEATDNSDLISDTDQLAGLCARMDGEAFLPLTETDLAPAIAKRIQQFADLVDDAVARLVDLHGASTTGLTTGGSQCVYGRFFKLDQLGMFLSSNPPNWAKAAETPLWLQVTEGDFKDTPRIADAIARAFAGTSRTFIMEGSRPSIAIHLPVGCERNDVLKDIIDQILEIAGVCGPTDTESQSQSTSHYKYEKP